MNKHNTRDYKLLFLAFSIFICLVSCSKDLDLASKEVPNGYAQFKITIAGVEGFTTGAPSINSKSSASVNIDKESKSVRISANTLSDPSVRNRASTGSDPNPINTERLKTASNYTVFIVRERDSAVVLINRGSIGTTSTVEGSLVTLKKGENYDLYAYTYDSSSPLEDPLFNAYGEPDEYIDSDNQDTIKALEIALYSRLNEPLMTAHMRITDATSASDLQNLSIIFKQTTMRYKVGFQIGLAHFGLAPTAAGQVMIDNSAEKNMYSAIEGASAASEAYPYSYIDSDAKNRSEIFVNLGNSEHRLSDDEDSFSYPFSGLWVGLYDFRKMDYTSMFDYMDEDDIEYFHYYYNLDHSIGNGIHDDWAIGAQTAGPGISQWGVLTDGYKDIKPYSMSAFEKYKFEHKEFDFTNLETAIQYYPLTNIGIFSDNKDNTHNKITLDEYFYVPIYKDPRNNSISSGTLEQGEADLYIKAAFKNVRFRAHLKNPYHNYSEEGKLPDHVLNMEKYNILKNLVEYQPQDFASIDFIARLTDARPGRSLIFMGVFNNYVE